MNSSAHAVSALIRKSLLVVAAFIASGLVLPSEALAAPSPPSVTLNPVNTTVNSGSNAVFTATASGDPAPSVKWQVSLDGITFTDYDGATSTTFTIPGVTSALHNAKVRAVFNNSQGQATTAPATLFVNYAPIVTLDPVFTSVTAGQTATFTAAAHGYPTPTVKWQVSTDAGMTFNDVPGATSTTLSFATVAADNDKRYRAVFMNSQGNTNTAAATLRVLSPPVVTLDPVNTSVAAGATASFTAASSGALTPQVQWEVSTDGGGSYNNVPAATGTTLNLFGVTAGMSGNLYRATFTNASGTDTTAAATLTVTSAPQVTTNPANQTVSDNTTASFTAAANGSPTPTVQWQSSPDGITFTNIPGETATTLSFTAVIADNGNRYRAVFTNSQGFANTSAATLTVVSGPAITLNPVSVTKSSGQTAIFTAAASGSPVPTVQWEFSTDGGGTFNNVPGATNTTLNVTGVTPAQNGTQYRAAFTNSQGSVTSTAATLTVQFGPTVVTNPGNLSVNQGSVATFTASASGNPTPTVQWQVSTNNGGTFSDIGGATSTTLSFVTTAADNGKQYRAVFTNANGAAETSAASLTVLVATTTTLSASNLTPLMNEPTTLTAVVTPTPSGGTVTFKEGVTPICSNVVLVSGSATCSASFATAGSHIVTATFNGSGNFVTSTSSPLTLAVVDQRAKTVAAIGNFLSLRNDMLLANGPDNNRQVDRLLAFQQGGSGGGRGFAAGAGASPVSAGQPMSHGFARGGGFSGAPTATDRLSGSRTSLDDLLVRTGFDANDASQDTASSFFPTMGSVRGSMDDDVMNVSFATSLSELVRFGEDTLNANETRSSRLSDRRASRFDVWLEGHLSGFDDDRGGIDSSGHFGVAYLGVDYVMRPWLLVGFLGQYDDMRQTSITNSFRTEGAGWMAGPYVTARLAPHLYLQARTAWGLSSNKVSPFLTYADTFDSTRWLLSATLTGAWSEGNWQFTPSASLAYIDDQSEAYVDHFSVLIPSVETSLGQFRAEPEISYRHLFEDGTLLEPRLKASAIWNFESSASAAAFGGTLAGPEELRGKIEAGIGLRFNDGVSVDLSGSYDGIGSSEYDAHGVSLGVRFPFN